MLKTCEYCGKEFETQKKYQKYCSEDCSHKARKKKRQYICPQCGKTFIPTKATQIYCSRKCTWDVKKKENEYICEVCEKPFKSSDKTRRYCSKKCSFEGRIKYKFLNGESQNDPIYKVWHSMYSRCNNPKQKCYNDYGGRGIKVCDEWLDLENFYAWALKSGFKKGLSIERIDVNKNYSPDNCKWIELPLQAKNKRNNIRINYNGKDMILKDIAVLENVDYKYLWVVYKRLKDIYKALDRVRNYSRKNKNKMQ